MKNKDFWGGYPAEPPPLGNLMIKEGPKLITSDMEHPRGLPKEGGRGHRWRGCRTLRSLRFRCHKGMTWDWKKPLVNFLQLAKTHENAY